MKIYIAGRYSRREELAGYRDKLQILGYIVQARWLDGGHELDSVNVSVEENEKLRIRFALDDWEDVNAAGIVLSFTEPPHSKASRGGRHVEYGIALANKARVIVIGYRENIFHWLPNVEFCATWDSVENLLS